MMVQNEKMVSLGQLVAGVAHEINNPVSFIYGNVMHADDYFQDLLKMLQLYQREYPGNQTDAIREEIDDIDLKFSAQRFAKAIKFDENGSRKNSPNCAVAEEFLAIGRSGTKNRWIFTKGLRALC